MSNTNTNTHVTPEEYATFVNLQAKPGERIANFLHENPGKAALFHMGAALLGEVVELHLSSKEHLTRQADRDEFLKELGDIVFYAQWFVQKPFKPVNFFEQGDNIARLMELSEELFTKVKRIAIYEHPHGATQVELCNLGKAIIESCFLLASKKLGMTWQDIVDANYAKLVERYPDGYSDKSAQERADVDGFDDA